MEIETDKVTVEIEAQPTYTDLLVKLVAGLSVVTNRSMPPGMRAGLYCTAKSTPGLRWLSRTGWLYQSFIGQMSWG